MKCRELIEELIAPTREKVDPARTCDTVKSGDPEREITGVGVTMFATPEVVRQAAKRGWNMLIVHEPTYYNHMDHEVVHEAAKRKEALIRESGIVIFRFHDHAHRRDPDLICEGELRDLGLRGEFQRGNYLAVNRFILDAPMTARELARCAEERLGLDCVRIAGDPETFGRRMSLCFGTPGHVDEELCENDFVLTGEISEWAIGQIARDYAEMGMPKAILVMGHIGSERAGMKLLADRLRTAHPEFETGYIECGELYSYT